MGVMNVTPNSFSDGGRFENKDAIHSQIMAFLKQDVSYLDIGAESTAPMNAPIGQDEEWLRLQMVLEVLKETYWEGFISLDTYKPEIANLFFKELLKRGYKSSQFLWNDVSGIWDKSVEDFFHEFSDSRYVFCHNEAPSREETSHHMKYVLEGSVEDVFSEVVSFFKKANIKAFKNRVLLDPCFGFSKTYEQNWSLIYKFFDFMDEFPENELIFGISRKSFLRKWWQENVNKDEDNREILLQKSEILHASVIGEFCKKTSPNKLKKAIFRVHDPDIVHFAYSHYLSK